MHQRRSLLLDRADQPGVRMAEQVDRDPGGEIEVAGAVLGNEVAVLAAHRPDLAPGIDGHQRSDRHGGNFLSAKVAQTTIGAPKDRRFVRYGFCWTRQTHRHGWDDDPPWSALTGTRLTAEISSSVDLVSNSKAALR